MNDESIGKGLSPGTWLDLLDAGWPGRAAIARLVLVIATGWVVLRPERVIDPTTQLPALAIPTLAVVTIGLTRTGGDLAALGVVAGIVHALAMAVWFGGVVLLARVVLAGPGEEDLVQAVRGFGRISGPAIVLTVVSGLVQLYRLDGGSLFSSSHGRVLVLKTVFVAIMLFVGLTARQVAMQRLNRAPDLTPPTADRLRRAFGTEAIIGLVVIGLSGWMMSFTPAKADVGDTTDFAVEEPFVDEPSGIDLVVQLNPARVGGNELRVRVNAPETGLSGLVIDFIPPDGLRPGRRLPADRPHRRRRGAVRARVPPARGRRAVDDAGRRDDGDGHDDVDADVPRRHRRRRAGHAGDHADADRPAGDGGADSVDGADRHDADRLT